MTPEHGIHRGVDDVELHYTRVRAGHAAVILVAPGILMERSGPEHRRLAAALSEVADVVTLDVRGHGDSGGRFSWGRVEPEDVASLALALRADYARVGGVGFSFGGYHTAIAAAVQRPYDAVALVAAPESLFLLDHNPLTRGLARSLPLMLGRKRRLTRFSLRPPRFDRSPLRLIDAIAPVPLLIVHGEADWLIPADHARRLFERAGEPKELCLLPGALHAENMLLDDPGPLLEALTGFFRRTLR